MYYDALHRLTDVGNNNQSATNPCKRFRYDNQAGYPGSTRPSGLANTLGRLIEAATDECDSGGDSIITDEWFSYDARGEETDLYQSTPNSDGYYHSATSYLANGVVNQLTGASGYYMTWGVDGEGRVSSTYTPYGQNPATGTSFNAASQPTQVNFGSGDSDNFTYDPNTGRMTQYKYNVGGQSVVGNLTWNALGTLASLAITDPFDSSNTQTCNYSHDDLARIASANCGSVWSQTFSYYDPFGNIEKSGNSNFSATYSPTTNQMTSIGGSTPSYDADGDVTNDFLNTYTWNAYGRPITADGVGITYDALGRMVEQNRAGTYTQLAYSPSGFKMQLMDGMTFAVAFVPLPSGAMAIYTPSGTPTYYRHSDWLGSSRLASTPSQTMYSDSAYAPFGEVYAQAGTSDESFTGMDQNTSSNLYDFPAREYGIQGRWPSPDPSGIKSADPTNPQTWNRYAYVVNNPLSLTDPTGLQLCDCSALPDGDVGPDGSASDAGNSVGGFCDAAGDCGSGTLVDGMPGANIGPGSETGVVSGAAVLTTAETQYVAAVNYTIEGNWLAAGFIVQRGPGGVYYNPNLAAAAAFDLIFSTNTDAGSGTVRAEYGGNVYANQDGTFSYTFPTSGPSCTVDTQCSYQPYPQAIPFGTTLAGLYHSHPFGGTWSINDTHDADQLNVPSFLGFPSGNVCRYEPNSSPVIAGSVTGTMPCNE